ncbi:MAG: hypothetical protein J5929_02805 [Eubacterium sp.]|nr:hypothetical protein [Eubacterium sp.]
MLFEEMITQEKKDAFMEKRKIKTKYEKEFVEFTENYIYSEEFDNDIKRLINKDYYFDLPTCFLIRKSLSNRRRKVFKFNDKEKIVLQFLNYLLIRKYNNIFSDNLYSARIENRTRNLFTKIKNLDPERKLYAVKSDIHRYSESIDLDILEKQLWKYCSDEPEFIEFIMWLMRRGKYYYKDEVVEAYTSVMGGNPTSAFFYNLNLLEVDKVMTERSILYCRYADDICIMNETKEEAEENMKLLVKMVRDLHLEFNDDKSAIVGPGEELDLLGIKFANGYVDIADNTFSKVTNKFKHRANSLNRGVRKGRYPRERAAEMMARIMDGYLYGYRYVDTEEESYSWIERVFPTITTADRLHIIDKVSEDCIRFVGTGRKTNAKYRITYDDIKRLGFRPLVHSYYHRFDDESVLKPADR